MFIMYVCLLCMYIWFHVFVLLSQVVKHLIEHGCKINCQDSTGNTALHYCCLNGNNAAANLLLEVRCVRIRSTSE